MSGKIKLGIVGFGRIVELVHLPLLGRSDDYEAAGVFDETPQRLELARRRGFETFGSLRELLESPAEAILIATPPNSHLAIAKACLDAGKHVLLEKPVTLSYPEAAELLQAANRAGRIASVFHNRRYDRDFQLVRTMIREGALGSVLFVERRHHQFGSGASFGVKSYRPGWRNEAGFGGGALLDWGVHLADQLLQLRLGEWATVDGRMHRMRPDQGEVEDYASASIGLDNGTRLRMEVNFGSNAASPLWVVGGEAATLQVVSEREAYILEKGKPPRPVADVPAARDGPFEIYASFARSLRTGEEPAVRLEEASEAMKALDAIRQSARERRELAYGHSVYVPASRV